jgi:hypothetical protein
MLVNGQGGSGLATTAELRILVLPGDKAWLAEAYGMLKAAHGAWSAGAWMVLVEGAGMETSQRLWSSLRETAMKFLGFAPAYLGCLPKLKESQGGSEAAHGGLLAEALLDARVEQPVNFEQYWQRLWLFSRMAADAGTAEGSSGRRGYGSRYSG